MVVQTCVYGVTYTQLMTGGLSRSHFLLLFVLSLTANPGQNWARQGYNSCEAVLRCYATEQSGDKEGLGSLYVHWEHPTGTSDE